MSTTRPASPSARRPAGTGYQPWGELAAARELPRLLARSPWLLRQPRGRGRSVMVLPGWRMNDVSTTMLQGYLRALGYRCRGWGLGINDGDLQRLVPGVADALRGMGATERPVALVGQSLGGLVAREVLRQHPELVAQVVTLGSPIFRRSSQLLPRPVTVVASRADRVVPYSRAFDGGGHASNVEVRSSHFGMGIDPDVWKVVAQALAAD